MHCYCVHRNLSSHSTKVNIETDMYDYVDCRANQNTQRWRIPKLQQFPVQLGTYWSNYSNGEPVTWCFNVFKVISTAVHLMTLQCSPRMHCVCRGSGSSKRLGFIFRIKRLMFILFYLIALIAVCLIENLVKFVNQVWIKSGGGKLQFGYRCRECLAPPAALDGNCQICVWFRTLSEVFYTSTEND